MICSDFSSCVYFFIFSLANPLLVLLTAVALALFLWGIVRYIYSAGSAEKSDGRTMMIWGVIALAVLVSLWGIVTFIASSFLPSY